MYTWHRRWLLGVGFAFAGAALVLLAAFLPLFVGTLASKSAGEQHIMTITGWGFDLDGGGEPSTQTGSVPANAFPMVFAAILLFAGTVVALLAARTVATPRSRRGAVVTLAIAAAFAAGTALTVGIQVISWVDSFRSTGSVPGDVDSAVGTGFWLLLVGTILAIGAALHAAKPVREPDLATPPLGIPVLAGHDSDDVTQPPAAQSG